MRKLIAIIAAIGFIGSTTLSPVIAAQAKPGRREERRPLGCAKKKAKKKAKKAELTVDRPLGCRQEEGKKKAKKAELRHRSLRGKGEEEEGQEGRAPRHRPLAAAKKKAKKKAKKAELTSPPISRAAKKKWPRRR